ncbi:MAG: hypothetical protein ACLTT1_03465 [[Clostridium] scindens]
MDSEITIDATVGDRDRDSCTVAYPGQPYQYRNDLKGRERDYIPGGCGSCSRDGQAEKEEMPVIHRYYLA